MMKKSTFETVVDSVPKATTMFLKFSGMLAQSLSDAIQHSGKDKKEIASLSKMHPSHLSRILASDSNTTLKTIARLSAALEVELIEFPLFEQRKNKRRAMRQQNLQRGALKYPDTSIGVFDSEGSFDILADGTSKQAIVRSTLETRRDFSDIGRVQGNFAKSFEWKSVLKIERGGPLWAEKDEELSEPMTE